MKVSFDPAKRGATLAGRGLNFADAPSVFAGPTLTHVDERGAYPEVRWQTYGLLDGRMVIVVWTGAGDGRRIISMRKCNEREYQRYHAQLG